MPVTRERVQRLREFGFSEYVARVYLALLDLGVAPARDVSTLSKVPTSKIYHVLEQLHEKGLVEILPESPKRYAPVPFQEYLDRLAREHRDAARTIERDRDDLATQFSIQGDTDLARGGFFTTVRGRRNVIGRIREMLEGATRDVLAMGTPGMALRHTNFHGVMRDLRERGVRVRILVPVEGDGAESLASLAELVELRHRCVPEGTPSNVAILVCDGEEALVTSFIPDDGHLYQGKDVALHTDQASMVSTMRALVEPLWGEAPPFEARRRELEEGRPPEFTRYYTHQEAVQRAFLDAIDDAEAFVYVNPLPARALGPAGRALHERLRESPATQRIILNFQDEETVRAFMEMAGENPTCEFRHLNPAVFSRFMVFDDREAMFSAVHPRAMSLWEEDADPANTQDLYIHTSNGATVASLRRQFQDIWEQAIPLEERLRELRAYPQLHPRDLGIGRLFDSVQDAVVVTDTEGNVVLWNSGAEEVFGYTADEMVGAPVERIIPESLREDHREGVRRFAHTGTGRLVGSRSPMELPAVRKDGKEVTVEMSLSAVPGGGDGRHVLAIIRDATARKRAQDALRRRERQFAHAVDMAGLARWEMDLRRGTVEWSEELFPIFGVDPDGFGGTLEEVLERVHPEDRPRVRERVRRALEQGGEYGGVTRAVRPDGEVRVVRVRGDVELEDGEPVRVVGVVQDVTEAVRGGDPQGREGDADAVAAGLAEDEALADEA